MASKKTIPNSRFFTITVRVDTDDEGHSVANVDVTAASEVPFSAQGSDETGPVGAVVRAVYRAMTIALARPVQQTLGLAPRIERVEGKE